MELVGTSRMCGRLWCYLPRPVLFAACRCKANNNTLRLHARQVTRHDARLAGFANLTMVQVGRAELEAACVHCRRWIGTAALRAGTVLVRLSAMPWVGVWPQGGGLPAILTHTPADAWAARRWTAEHMAERLPVLTGARPHCDACMPAATQQPTPRTRRGRGKHDGCVHF